MPPPPLQAMEAPTPDPVNPQGQECPMLSLMDAAEDSACFTPEMPHTPQKATHAECDNGLAPLPHPLATFNTPRVIGAQMKRGFSAIPKDEEDVNQPKK